MRRLTLLAALLLCAPGALRGQSVCPTPWQLEEVLRIGSFESTDLVASVLDLAIGPDSALYVAQAMVPAVTVFSLDGQVLRRIGRAGQGPGDIELAARSVGWVGDTLWIADFSRVQLFTTDERRPEQIIQFSRSVPEEGSLLTPGRMLADGTVDAQLFPGTHPLRDLPPLGLGEYLTAVTPDGSAVVRIGEVHEDATPPTFDLLVISIRGDTLLQRSVEYERRDVTRAMERRLEDEYAGWRAGDYYPTGLQSTETTLERRRRAARGRARRRTGGGA